MLKEGQMASPRTPPLPQVLPIGKFAEWAHTSKRTVWRHLRTGKLECIVVGGRKKVVVPPIAPAAGGAAK
jgi:hypothetical protein